jgi:hypothetical protein
MNDLDANGRRVRCRIYAFIALACGGIKAPDANSFIGAPVGNVKPRRLRAVPRAAIGRYGKPLGNGNVQRLIERKANAEINRDSGARLDFCREPDASVCRSAA